MEKEGAGAGHSQLLGRIPSSAWLAPTAVVIGEVEIGNHSRIGPNSVVRADSGRVTIGEQSIIQENCFIKASPPNGVTLGRRVMVGHRSVLEGCVVHDEAVLGAGVVVMEGAQIGKGALIQPGTMVPSNSVIPPYTLCRGIPGRAVRSLTPQEIDELKKKWVIFEHQFNSRLAPDS